MPLTIPEPRYFSIPSRVVGGATLRKAALNWRPCVRSVTQVPLAWTNSPAAIAAAAPTTVARSRWPRTLTRSTQKPVSGVWNVTRSTSPASASRSGAPGALAPPTFGPRPGLVSVGSGRVGNIGMPVRDGGRLDAAQHGGLAARLRRALGVAGPQTPARRDDPFA